MNDCHIEKLVELENDSFEIFKVDCRIGIPEDWIKHPELSYGGRYFQVRDKGGKCLDSFATLDEAKQDIEDRTKTEENG